MTRETVMHRVRKMLDKAQSTEFEAERQTFLQKASSMMAQHAIDMAEVEAGRETGKPEEIVERVCFVGPAKSPASHSKGHVAMAVADTHRCKMFRQSYRRDEDGTIHRGYHVHFVGYESDVDYVEMLWTSLCLQMEREYEEAKVDKRDFVNGRTFRKNFEAGFASEARERLEAMQREATRTVEAAQTGSSLVLRDRARDVADHVRQKYSLRSGRSYYRSDGHAQQAGRAAAARADYSGGSRRGIRAGS